MNCRGLSVLVGVFVVVLSSLSGAEEMPVGGLPNAVLTDAEVLAILEAGRAAKSLPANVFVRVEAQLGRSVPADDAVRAKAERNGANFKANLREIWEFTTDHSHRVVVERPKKSGDPTVFRRVASAPFDSSGICKELLDGKIFSLSDGQGGGTHHFAGTQYDVGHRSIQIFVNDKPALFVGESCLTPGFSVRDARAFAALYERLATKARGPGK